MAPQIPTPPCAESTEGSPGTTLQERQGSASSAKNPPRRYDPLENIRGRPRMQRLADFLFEAGMLKKTPRTGFQFLGSGSENVAEHSFRTALIGFVLASMAGANAERSALLCLIHDFHEARTGDFNYVNSMYNSSKQRLAMEHALMGTGLSALVLALWDEQDSRESPEGRLSRDADQIDLILNLVQERVLGNPYAEKWIEPALKRLQTPEGKALAMVILETDPADWWFKGPDEEWWVKKGKE